MEASYSTGGVGSAGQMLVAQRGEFAPGCQDVGLAGLLLELDADALGVASSTATRLQWALSFMSSSSMVLPLRWPSSLADLFLQLLFFVLDVGDDVAEDVERGDAGVARAGDGLHGADEEALDAEVFFERLEGEYEADGTAVGVGDDVAAGLASPLLGFDQAEVAGVDFRDDERHVGGHAEGAGVRDDGATGGGKLRFKLVGDVGIQCRKDNLGQLDAGTFGHVGLDRHGRDVGGQRRVELPLAGFAIDLACAAIARRKPGNLKPRVIAQ